MALNWSGGVSGATSGAIAGTGVAPGWGTAAGTAIGFLGGLFSGGDKDKMKNISGLLPQQQQGLLDILDQLRGMQGPEGTYGMSQDYLRDLLSNDPQGFANFAAPHETYFNEQIIPRLAERFAGMGGGLGGGVLGSSGFGQAIGGAANQFSSNLAQVYQNLRNQAAQSAMSQYNNLANFGLNTQAFQPHYQQGNIGFGGRALEGTLSGVTEQLGRQGAVNLSDKIKKWTQ